jgi:hypothetical protein
MHLGVASIFRIDIRPPNVRGISPRVADRSRLQPHSQLPLPVWAAVSLTRSSEITSTRRSDRSNGNNHENGGRRKRNNNRRPLPLRANEAQLKGGGLPERDPQRSRNPMKQRPVPKQKGKAARLQ